MFVIVAFPALMLVAIHAEPSGRLHEAALWGGAISYPLYAIHDPLLDIAVLLRPGGASEYLRMGFWVISVGLIVGLATWVERRIDRPARRWLQGWAGGKLDS